jgi:hypothetical protein
MATVQKCPLYRLNSTSRGNGDFNTIPAGINYGDFLYWNGSEWKTDSNKVHLGANAGRYNQGLYAIALGQAAGTNNQSTNAISIGYAAGNYYQGLSAIAIGLNAGLNLQGENSIAIGANSGYQSQGNNAIALGYASGADYQGQNAVAIGQNAGSYGQGTGSIAIGQNAGSYFQGQRSIAIGQTVGITGQGDDSIIIGQNAESTGNESIVLNASSLVQVNAATSGLFINPIRGPFSSSNVLSYNTTTNEIFYNGSSKRYKHDIEPLTNNTENLYKLTPREFKYNINGEEDIGLIAEEADNCDPWFAYKDSDGIPEGIQWNSITTYLIAEMKKMKEDIEGCEKEIEALKKIIK